MTDAGFPTVLIGFGQIGTGYAEDTVMARHYRYATHAQVLQEHKAFRWTGVVDPSKIAREEALTRWKLPEAAADISALRAAAEAEVVVLATPPEIRLSQLEHLPKLKAVLVEKPLAPALATASSFLDYCRQRDVIVQVNLWRRADSLTRRLASGDLKAHIGRIQAATGIYGNGLRNNGLHMVDMVRMLLGEVTKVQALGEARHLKSLPLKNDIDIGFALTLETGLTVVFLPIDFTEYRENALDLWGTQGLLSIRQEGLNVTLYPRAKNRAMDNQREISSDRGRPLKTTVGHALWDMYDNLASALAGEADLVAPGLEALASEAVIEAVVSSARSGGTPVAPDCL